ncbi:hypothetical protein JMUB6875_15470 [Nocardia sp. JMUB6875]|uniref:WXG100 family type VII secretion target n=1 Tax=Nocardia sp. JMUB6875 TaxID=3158170 RepID=UPI0032E6E916
MTGSDNAAGRLEVLPNDVQAFGRLAYRIAEELRAGSDNLDKEVKGLRSTWQGAAAKSYEAGWTEMHHGATEVWDALFDLASKLGITAETYRGTDAEFGAALSSLELP